MAHIYLANAPCSWGTLEFNGLGGEQIGYRQMLDELAETGYTGTELGDWGYMPTDPDALRAELAARRLSMQGAFVPVALKDAAAHEDGRWRVGLGGVLRLQREPLVDRHVARRLLGGLRLLLAREAVLEGL